MTVATKERPILFSGAMVRAILDGRKTQTRRIVNPQPPESIDALHGYELSKRAPYDIEDEEQRVFGWGFQDDDNGYYKFPYGSIGDHLWVRETHMLVPASSGIACNPNVQRTFGGADQAAVYATDKAKLGDIGPFKPSIHMPRWASRITLEINRVRVEQLNAISGRDVLAEGVDNGSSNPTMGVRWENMQRMAFESLWESINGPDSWVANPWVWVISFERKTN